MLQREAARRYSLLFKTAMTDIALQFEPPFARIVLNRPERRNAISRAMWRALPAIRTAIEARDDVLVALVEGAAGHFSVGADISEFDEVYRDAAAARDYGDAVQDGLRALIDLNRPTIAVLRGNAVGGGLGLALACDLRFCAADVYLAVTPAKLGLVYGHAETRRLIELVGPSRAKDLLFTGRRIETEEALAIGLIDRRVETALEETVLGYARGLAELSQASIRGAKRAVDAIAGGLMVETPAFRGLVESAALGPDFVEGRAAFSEKRTPKFSFRGSTGPLKG
jgi:enoyl-CoA hydratase/carnithine racemase